MCGIAGKVSLGSSEITVSELKTMADKIAYRGPDDEGYYISQDKKVGLANRRLAIIDLSKNGHQPMSYKKRYFITYNGEIYNFQFEKKKLKKIGYRFRSHTDTEIILALYDRYKTNCLRYLRGMFAFAIYDAKERTLFLARDRLGKKPLKYYYDRDTFIFASELKAILTQKEVKRVPDWMAIHSFLTYGYTPAPSTGFEKIYKLKPGHYLLLDLKSVKVKVRQYWKLNFSEKLTLSEDEWCGAILNELEEATKLRMISDVPIGAFLSGGSDSSAVVATMARLSSKPVKTFTIIYKEKTHDEAKYARQIAKMYGTDHSELLAKPESIEILPELVYYHEEPYGNSSAVVAHLVSKIARNLATVVLNGDGGDENFAGYSRFFRVQRDYLFDKYFSWTRELAIPLVTFASDFRKSDYLSKLKKFLYKNRLPFPERYISYNFYFSNEDKELLYTDKLKTLTGYKNAYDFVTRLFEEAATSDIRDCALYCDFNSYLSNDFLAKMDIANMRYSLEGRSPLLDYKFVEMAAKIPFDLKVKNGETKYIFKKALEGIVPKENLFRPKMGFSIPLRQWFSGKLNEYAKSILLGRRAKKRGIFKTDEVERMLHTHTKSQDFGPRLWVLLTLELWFREFID